jgi:hypothetical protein
VVISHSEKINCTQERLWKLLLDKAEHPEKTISEVQKVKILQKYDNGFLREMSVAGLEIIERIIIDQKAGQIKFILVDNEELDGYFLNKIENKHGQLTLTYLQDWIPKDQNAKQDFDQQFYPILKNAVLAIKKIAEMTSIPY